MKRTKHRINWENRKSCSGIYNRIEDTAGRDGGRFVKSETENSTARKNTGNS